MTPEDIATMRALIEHDKLGQWPEDALVDWEQLAIALDEVERLQALLAEREERPHP